MRAKPGDEQDDERRRDRQQYPNPGCDRRAHRTLAPYHTRDEHDLLDVRIELLNWPGRSLALDNIRCPPVRARLSENAFGLTHGGQRIGIALFGFWGVPGECVITTM